MSEPQLRFTPHVTVATIVPGIGANAGKFLFVEEKSDKVLVINQPAGHLDPSETLLDAAIRETLEETAWRVEITHLVGVYQYQLKPENGAAFPRAYLRFCFAAKPIAHDPARALDDGIERILWLTRAELIARQAQHRSPMVLRCLDAYLAGAQHSLKALHGLLGN